MTMTISNARAGRWKRYRPGRSRPQQVEGHYGSPGMRERARLIGGKLTVWSEVDAGTEVELLVPSSAAYPTARRGFLAVKSVCRKSKGLILI